MDCGKSYSHDPELPFDQFPVQPDKIDYLFLTHAHIDHIGRVPVTAGIHTLTGYSAHADQRMLVNWVKSMPQPPEQIRLVHGESHARQALIKALGSQY